MDTLIKERPILFSGEMVRAILDGRKTQTRRVINAGVLDGQTGWRKYFGDKYQYWGREFSNSFEKSGVKCPYGQPGDRLWVRETWYPFGDMIFYRASIPKEQSVECKWRPSIHMPRTASRILLENKNVRAERLNEISEADAIAEGVESFRPVPGDGPAETLWKNYNTGKYTFRTARESFFSLIEYIYGPDFLKQNHWVWVIEFKRIKP